MKKCCETTAREIFSEISSLLEYNRVGIGEDIGEYYELIIGKNKWEELRKKYCGEKDVQQ